MKAAGGEIEIAVGERATCGRVYPAAGTSGAALILAHGAGAPQAHPFMVRYAEGLATRGVDCATFDFLYTHAGRRTPDRTPDLEAGWRAAIATLQRHAALDGKRLFIGGKSMGGRIATQVAAKGVEGSTIAGLVLLGYPLHPPGKPEQLRAKHLVQVRAPMLFVQGARDAFGGPDELRPILARLDEAKLIVVDGGDHSFAVPKRNGVPQEQVHEWILDGIARWIAGRRSAATGT